MNAREGALSVLNKVDEKGAYTNLALDQLIKSGKVREKNLLTRLVYGTLQNREIIDRILRRYITRGFNKLKDPVKNALRLAVYELLMLDSIPDYAAINSAVNQVKKSNKRVSGMANAVLRRIAGDREVLLQEIDQLSPEEKASLPSWILDLFKQSYQDKADAVFERLNSRPPLTVRKNSLKADEKMLFDILGQEGIDATTHPYVDEMYILEGNLPPGGVEGLKAYKEGLMTVQDAGAGKISQLLSPKPYERVADLCAAPGGKSTHLAAIMDDQGEVLAGDIHASRVKLIEENANRLGADIVKAVQMDASKPNMSEKFDKILLDVPCSGLGIIRRKPEIRYRMQQEDLKSLEKLQEKILNQADSLLKDGGEMVYSTCTINPGENGKQITKFLENHPGYQLIKEELTSPLEESDCFYMAKLKKES